MATAYMKIANRDDLYLQDTRVDNLFILEFLPGAPEGFVKVYLFGLMYAQNNISLDTGKLARVLRIPESDVVKAWIYWEEKGLICFEHNDDLTEYRVDYLSLVDSMYGKHTRATEPSPQREEPTKPYLEVVFPKALADELPGDVPTVNEGDAIEDEYLDLAADDEEDAVAKVVNREIQAIYQRYEEKVGRTLSYEESWKIGEAIKTYDILPDVMSYAVDYVAESDHPSVSSVVRTAVRWAQEGCKNLADVKEYLDARSKRNQYYNLVFHEMGWTRMPNPGDKEIMDRWFDELGYKISEVLDACRASSGLRDPSLKYVNKVLENRRLEAGGINTRKNTGTGMGLSNTSTKASEESGRAMVSKKVLREYYEYIRQEGEKELDARIDEACDRIIELRDVFELENKLNEELMSTSFTIGSKEDKDKLRDQRHALEEDKRRYLRENGYSEDFLVRRYRCSICKDTGITDDGRICTCSEARAQEAYKWNQERNH